MKKNKFINSVILLGVLSLIPKSYAQVTNPPALGDPQHPPECYAAIEELPDCSDIFEYSVEVANFVTQYNDHVTVTVYSRKVFNTPVIQRLNLTVERGEDTFSGSLEQSTYQAMVEAASKLATSELYSVDSNQPIKPTSKWGAVKELLKNTAESLASISSIKATLSDLFSSDDSPLDEGFKVMAIDFNGKVIVQALQVMEDGSLSLLDSTQDDGEITVSSDAYGDQLDKTMANELMNQGDDAALQRALINRCQTRTTRSCTATGPNRYSCVFKMTFGPTCPLSRP